MSFQFNSTNSNIILENIDSGSLIALNITTPRKVTQTKENEATNKLPTR